MDLTNKILTIIIPVYNTSSYLDKCILSITKQYNGSFVIFLVNDGSTDDSLEKCLSYKNKFDFIEVFSKDNGGLSSARNFGLNRVTTKYVTFVDSDDWIDDKYIYKIFEILKLKTVDLVIFNYRRVYNKKIFPVVPFEFDEGFYDKKSKNIFNDFLFGPLSIEEINNVQYMDSLDSVCMKIYKTDLIKDILFIDEKDVGSAEDLLFNLDAFDRAKSVCYLKDCLYFYRKENSKSLTHTFKKDFLLKWERMYSLIETHANTLEKNKRLTNRKALSFLSYCLYLDSCHFSYSEFKNKILDALKSNIYLETIPLLETKQMKFTRKVFYNFVKKKKIFFLYLLTKISSFLKGRFV